MTQRGMTTVSVIAAVDHDHAIGAGGQLPWHLPDDLRRFKALTLGKPVLMGRRTAESIGRPLPGRRNLVLSRRHDAPFEGQETIRTFDEALSMGTPDLIVIGGGEIYALALPIASHAYLTRVDTTTAAADTFFPALDPAEWSETAREPHASDATHAHAFIFMDYTRQGSVG